MQWVHIKHASAHIGTSTHQHILRHFVVSYAVSHMAADDGRNMAK